jgi:hypothetical protein
MTKEKWAALTAALLGLGALTLAGSFQARAYQKADETGQPGRNDKSKPPSGQKRAALREEEKALRKAAGAYSAAFNKGDLDAIAAFWTEDAEYVPEGGKAIRGRESVRALLKKSLAEHKGARQSIKVRSVRFVKPDVATE